MAITRMEYEYLMSLEKTFDDLHSPVQLGPAPLQWTRQLNAVDNREVFFLDYYRGGFELSHYTINKRYRQTIILLRFDSAGRHTNPGGERIEGAHVHLYREGYNDKFAFPVAEVGVSLSDSIEQVFVKIMYFCNIRRYPQIEIPMF
jgi:hypothetical protein